MTDDVEARPAEKSPSHAADPSSADVLPGAEAIERLSWRELVNGLPAAIYMTDAAGRITFFNETAATLWGREPVIGESDWCGSWKLYHVDGTPLPHDECPMAVTLKTGKPVRGVEALAERPDGTRVPFMPFPTPLHDATGQIIGGVNMLVDLTEAKHAEAAALRLAAIVESSDDAIISKDLNGVILSWNEAARRLFGYQAEEVIGQPVTVLIPEQSHDEEPGILRRLRRGERIDHYETIRRRKDGSVVDISLTVSPIKDARGIIIGASKIARDISDRKEAEARQRLLTRELHHRTKNLFAVVQAVVARSFAGKATVEEAQTAVMDRLHSLGQAHILLVDRQWQGTDFRELVSGEMRPFSDRITISGPALIMNPQAAQSFALAVHELATNAIKYGALSSPTGRVVISWSVDAREGAGEFAFHWQESDGPPVATPLRKGFGSTVLEQVMAEYAATPPSIEFAPSGVVYKVAGPLSAIAAVEPQPRARPAFER